MLERVAWQSHSSGLLQIILGARHGNNQGLTRFSKALPVLGPPAVSPNLSDVSLPESGFGPKGVPDPPIVA